MTEAVACGLTRLLKWCFSAPFSQGCVDRWWEGTLIGRRSWNDLRRRRVTISATAPQCSSDGYDLAHLFPFSTPSSFLFFVVITGYSDGGHRGPAATTATKAWVVGNVWWQTTKVFTATIVLMGWGFRVKRCRETVRVRVRDLGSPFLKKDDK